MARPAVRRGARSWGPALALLDDAFHLLRRRPGLLALHSAGAMPFGLAVLFFWTDMSRNALAAERCAGESLLLAFLYLWMKAWHSRFMSALQAEAAGDPDPHWPAGRVVRVLLTQAAIQWAALPALLAAALLTVPVPWCLAFFQNATLYANGEHRSLGEIVRKSWAMARVQPGQNAAIVGVLSLCAAVVFLEALVAMLWLPELVRLFTGVETVLSRGVRFLLNSTLLAAAGVLSWLAVDPLLKAACVLRCFRAEAAATGSDLLLKLRRCRELRLAGARALVWAILGGLLATAGTAPASEAGGTPPIDPSVLRQRLEQTLGHPRYAWRLPRTRPAVERPGAAARFLRPVWRWLRRALTACRDGLRAVADWLRRVLGRRDAATRPETPGGRAWEDVLPYAVVFLTSAVAAGLAVSMLRAWRSRRRGRAAPMDAAASALSEAGAEALRADERPHGDWLQAARDLMARGEPRLALRAAYLASLALLAEKRLLSLAAFKSNLDYRRELARRAAQRPQAVASFEAIVRAFDRAWYGNHPATLAVVGEVLADLDRMRGTVDA